MYNEKMGVLIHGMNLLRLVPKKEIVFPKFLLYLLKNTKSRAYFQTRCKRAVNQSSLDQKTIKNFEFILPPIETQHKIVEILEKAEKLKEWRTEADKLTDEYLKSVFLVMFGDPEKRSSNSVFLKDLVQILDKRRIPLSKKDRSKMQGIYPYYGATGILDYVNDFIFDEELILMGEDGQNLISRNRPMAFKVKGKIWVNNHAHVLKPEDVNIDYLTFYLDLIDYDPYITGSAQPKLNQNKLGKILVKNPPIELQNQFSHIVEKVKAVKTQQNESDIQIDNLFNVLMQKAFNGELVC